MEVVIHVFVITLCVDYRCNDRVGVYVLVAGDGTHILKRSAEVVAQSVYVFTLTDKGPRRYKVKLRIGRDALNGICQQGASLGKFSRRRSGFNGFSEDYVIDPYGDNVYVSVGDIISLL